MVSLDERKKLEKKENTKNDIFLLFSYRKWKKEDKKIDV